MPKSANYRKRYGNIRHYKRQCAIAHNSTHGKCCVCLKRDSQELHHASYGNDKIGLTVFPVCKTCHKDKCHSRKNWIIDRLNPTWNNRNTPAFLERLKLGYKLLYLS